MRMELLLKRNEKMLKSNNNNIINKDYLKLEINLIFYYTFKS